VLASRMCALAMTAIAACAMLTLSRAQAQWWSRAPVDFEECAENAEKAANKEEKSAQLTECNAKFAGRRKPGGGYTYYDFMQNRSFDIAGPNPTKEEQKKIDEQYTAFLEQERRNSIAAAISEKQQQLLQQASLKDEKVPPPAAAPSKPPPAASEVKPRPRADDCARHSFSCDWPRLSEGWKDLKKLFSPSPSKAKRG
jgi:hypothetical protein